MLKGQIQSMSKSLKELRKDLFELETDIQKQLETLPNQCTMYNQKMFKLKDVKRHQALTKDEKKQKMKDILSYTYPGVDGNIDKLIEEMLTLKGDEIQQTKLVVK